ncbi:MAG: SpoIID/LytB domain-containing protein [Deltaproteobacteria bacterium]
MMDVRKTLQKVFSDGRKFFFGHTRLLKYFITAFMIAFLFCFSRHGFAQDFKTSMDEADAYLRNGQYLEAVGAYQEVSERTPDSDIKAKAILRIGDIYGYFLNNYDKALEKYHIVTKQYAGSLHAANAYFNSGMILYERNRYGEALNQFKTYIEKYPKGERRETAQFMIETCSGPPSAMEEKKAAAKTPVDENVRVMILTGVRETHLDSPSPLEIRDIGDKNVLARVENAVVDVHQRSIRLNGNRLSVDRLIIAPSDGSILILNGQPYRGKFRILKNPKGGMDVVNVLGIEAYLYGVIPKEMSPQWFPEALRAQAIAARTYALYQMDKGRNREFDVLSTTTSQVYGGASVEMEKSSRAVDETRGMVLRYNNQLVLAYFHANSGGMTEDAERVWTAEVPYLKAVRDDYSVKAPNCAWKLALPLDDIRKALNKKGLDIGRIEKIDAVDVSPSGRVMKIRISHGGRVTIVSGNEFRLKIDPVLIKSTLFSMTHNEREVVFEGKGYGHGVGLSQWGAYIMAREGRSYGEILRYYYQGVEIGTP